MNTTVFNAFFFSFLITSVIGFVLKCGSMAYKSKCKEFECCCLKIVRDVESEAWRVPQIKKIGIIFLTIFLVKIYSYNSIRIYNAINSYKKPTTNTRGYY